MPAPILMCFIRVSSWTAIAHLPLPTCNKFPRLFWGNFQPQKYGKQTTLFTKVVKIITLTTCYLFRHRRSLCSRLTALQNGFTKFRIIIIIRIKYQFSLTRKMPRLFPNHLWIPWFIRIYIFLEKKWQSRPYLCPACHGQWQWGDRD